MQYRKGEGQEHKWVIMEFMGAITLALLLALFGIHFLGGLGLGCAGDSGCMKAKEELEQLVDDVNQVCQSSDISEGDRSKLGEYDFGPASALGISHPNTFRVARFRDAGDGLPSKMEFIQKGVKFTTLTRAWTVERKAENCDKVNICTLFSDVEGCHKGIQGGAQNFFNGGHVPFWSQLDSKGHIYYGIPEGGTINLKWVDHEINLPDLPDEELECGTDYKNTCTSEGECLTPSNNDEHNAQCGSGEVCCRSIGSP